MTAISPRNLRDAHAAFIVELQTMQATTPILRCGSLDERNPDDMDALADHARMFIKLVADYCACIGGEACMSRVEMREGVREAIEDVFYPMFKQIDDMSGGPNPVWQDRSDYRARAGY